MFFIKKFLIRIAKSSFIILPLLGLLILGSMFLTLFEVTIDGRTISLNIISYFLLNSKFVWTMIVTVVVLSMAILFGFLSKLNKNLLGISAFFFILGTIFLALSKSFLNFDENINDIKVKFGLILAIIFSVVASLISLSSGYNESKNSLRDIAEEGMLVAMAFVLNLIKLFEAPGGGSINLQMLPLFVLALRHGPINGLICGGLIYGIITCLTDGWGIQFYPFDYLIGFGSIAILGLFKNFVFNGNEKYNIKSISFLIVGVVLSSFVRFIGGMISSMVYFYNNDAFIDGIVKSLIYNAPYIFISAGIGLAVIIALFPVLAKMNNRYPTTKN